MLACRWSHLLQEFWSEERERVFLVGVDVKSSVGSQGNMATGGWG